ncbi:MAG TPA: hypothetical protein PKC49_00580 [Phycisphaerae bacterium]|nr:hypothetical protein [Phycisphaerae bacterium]
MGLTREPPVDTPPAAATGTQTAPAPPPAPESPVPNDGPAPAAGRTAEPISPTSSNSLVSDTELEAALAEIEKLCTSRAGESSPAPSTTALGAEEDDLDADSQSDTHSQPETDAFPEAPADDAAATPDVAVQAPSAADEAAPPAGEPSPGPAPETAPAPPGKKIRFKIGRSEGAPAEPPAEPTPEPSRPPPTRDAPAAAEPPEPPQMPVATPGKRVYRMVDSLLDAANRPFVLLSGRMRDTIGAVAVATILVSILMPMLLNYMSPKRDPVSFLRQKRVEFERGPELRAEQAAHAGRHDAGQASPAPTGGGHGKAGGGSGKAGSGHH